MPIKKEDLSILGGNKEDKLVNETTKNNTIEVESTTLKEQSSKPITHHMPSNAPRDIMNKTVNIQKEKMNYSLID
jgi:hypothetical protein